MFAGQSQRDKCHCIPSISHESIALIYCDNTDDIKGRFVKGTVTYRVGHVYLMHFSHNSSTEKAILSQSLILNKTTEAVRTEIGPRCELPCLKLIAIFIMLHCLPTNRVQIILIHFYHLICKRIAPSYVLGKQWQLLWIPSVNSLFRNCDHLFKAMLSYLWFTLSLKWLVHFAAMNLYKERNSQPYAGNTERLTGRGEDWLLLVLPLTCYQVVHLAWRLL